MGKLFKSRVKELETQIDNYLDFVANSGLVFYEGIKFYIQGNSEKFEKKNQDLTELESKADELRRNIKHSLYTYMLIPESRGDVLALLENVDNIVDTAEKVLEQFSIEKPDIPEFLITDFINLAKLSRNSVDELVKGMRAFFKEINLVNDYVNKVHFYEHEADDIEETIKRKAFEGDGIKHFSKKVHMRYFTEKIALISDVAEAVAERLSVYTIKRRM